MEISERQKQLRQWATDTKLAWYDEKDIEGARSWLRGVFEFIQHAYSKTPAETRLSFDVVAIERDFAHAVADCLAYAEWHGWGREFLDRIEMLELTGVFRAKVLDRPVGPRVKETLEPSRGLRSAKFQSCILEHVDTGPVGSGILVAPDLILTAHHVVKDCWAQPGGHEKLRARFLAGEFEPFLEPNDGRGLVIPFAKGWDVCGSPSHGTEATDPRLDEAALDQNLDYALVRIPTSPGLTRGYPICGSPAGPDSVIWIFHAPGRAELRESRAVIREFYWCSESPRRLEYLIDAADNAPGSSGGACLDLEGRLVGHHQASVGQHDGASLCRGVPWAAVAKAMTRETLAPMKPAYLWWVRTPDLMDAQHGFRQQIAGGPYYRPLIGRHVFQDAILASMGPDPKWRAFFVSGPPSSGTTLTLRILETLLLKRDHIVGAIDVGSALIQERRYIDQLFAAVQERAQVQKVVRPYAIEVPEPPSYASVRSYVRARIDEIDRLREGRTVWLCIDGILAQPPANEFDRLSLEALYDVTPRYEWLRTVIMAPRPAALTDADAFFDPVAPPTFEEFAYYVFRRLKAAGQAVTMDAAHELAGDILKEAARIAGHSDLSAVEAGLAIDAVLAQLYPAGTDTDPIVRIKDPCW